MRTKLLAATVAFALAACGGGDDGGTTAPASGWIDVPGMVCADGSQTGIGISRGSTDAVLVYLSGGGACWSDTECDALRGPIGPTQFDFASRNLMPGTILDRTVSGNPFATWTIVAVPYCTGDVHAGDRENTYGGTTWLHRGYRNLEAAVARMAAEVAPPAQVVVAGSSAGGFGALVAYDLVRVEWPAGAVAGALVDDSAPTFVTTAMPEAILGAWWEAWGLASTVTPVCPNCETDLSTIWNELSASYPDDRLALVSTTRDFTMRSFFGDPNLDFAGPAYEAALLGLAEELASLPQVRTFVVGGASEQRHALLFPNRLSLAPPVSTYAASDGTTLLEWLSAMVDPDSAWTSHGP